MTGEQDRERDQDRERRMRRAAVAAATHEVPEPVPLDEVDPEEPRDDGADETDDSAYRRIEQQTLWVDMQVRAAMDRGEFDDLPGAGKPLRLPDRHDPDWWVKQLIERENVTGVLPPALGLRKEDTQLDGNLDRQVTEADVRSTIEDFNRRVVDARRQLLGGPPVVTPTRDVDTEVARWRERRRPDSSGPAPREGDARSRTNRGRWRRFRHRT